MVNKSATSRILRYLQGGRDLTATQARTRFGISNVSGRISELREAGYAIYLNEKKTQNGRTIKAYRLGAPTRRQIAAGHLVLTDPVLREALGPAIDERVNSL